MRLVLIALLLTACHHDYGSGGCVDDGSFKRPPTPIPAIPVEDER